MIRKLIGLGLVASTLAVAACAPTSRFEWGAYEQSLYAYAQNPEHRDAYKTSLVRAIAQGEKRNAVAPGFHAELGYLLMEEGLGSEALDHFRKERALFPESAPFMDRVILQLAPVPTPAPSAQGGIN